MKYIVAFLVLAPFTARADMQSDVDAKVDQLVAQFDACTPNSTTTDQLIACARVANRAADAYMENLVSKWGPILRSGPRGDVIYPELMNSQRLYVQYRRDLCAFAAVSRSYRPDSNTFHEVRCQFLVTLERLAHLYIAAI